MDESSVLIPGGAELVVAGLYIAAVAITALLAARRGRSPLGWGLLALVLTWVAAVVVALLPRRTAQR